MHWIIVKKFPLETDLSAVSGYLQQSGIVHQIYEETGWQVVAVNDARVVGAVLQFIEGVTQGSIRIETDNHVKTINKLEIPTMVDQIKAVPITSFLILLSALGALLVWLDQDYRYIPYFTFQNLTLQGFVPLSVSLVAGEWWRLVTPVFLHFSFFHVLFNGLWVWDLGRRLELLLGKKLYILFFMITGIASNACQFVWSGPGVFGGMSGVVYALVGFIIVRHKLVPHRLTAVSPGILIFMLAWLVLCMTGAVDYFIGGSVANAAHVGGLVAGCAFAFIFSLVTTKHVK